MKTIHKYPLRTVDRQKVIMAEGSTILHVGYQPSSGVCIWAATDTSEERMQNRYIRIFGTGHPLPDDWQETLTHIGTAIVASHVWHVFEEKGNPCST